MRRIFTMFFEDLRLENVSPLTEKKMVLTVSIQAASKATKHDHTMN